MGYAGESVDVVGHALGVVHDAPGNLVLGHGVFRVFDLVAHGYSHDVDALASVDVENLFKAGQLLDAPGAPRRPEVDYRVVARHYEVAELHVAAVLVGGAEVGVGVAGGGAFAQLGEADEAASLARLLEVGRKDGEEGVDACRLGKLYDFECEVLSEGILAVVGILAVGEVDVGVNVVEALHRVESCHERGEAVVEGGAGGGVERVGEHGLARLYHRKGLHASVDGELHEARGVGEDVGVVEEHAAVSDDARAEDGRVGEGYHLDGLSFEFFGEAGFERALLLLASPHEGCGEQQRGGAEYESARER